MKSAWAAAIFAILWPSRGFCSGEPAALSLRRLPGADSCAGVKELATRVDDHLGRSVFVSPAIAELLVEAALARRAEGGYAVSILLSDSTGATLGTRQLAVEATDCGPAIEAAALAIALMLDPDAVSPASRRDFAPSPAPSRPAPCNEPPEPARLPPVSPLPPSSPPEPPRWSARLNAGPSLAVGQLPGVALGVSFGVRLLPPNERAGIDVRGTYLWPRGADVEGGAGADFRSSSGALTGWFIPWRHGPLTLGLGAGLEVAAITAVGRGFVPSRYAQSWRVAGVLELELAWQRSGAFGLFVRPAAGVALYRDRFEGTPANGARTIIFEPTRAQASLTAGLTFGP